MKQNISEIFLEEDFKKNLKKIAVKSKKDDDFLFNQINSVIKSKKPKYSSVSEAVKEMMERSGLTSYLKQKDLQTKLSKKANENVRLFSEFPQAKITIDNFIESMGGYSPIPAVVSKIKSIHSLDVKDNSLFEDESLIKYIANKNIEEKSKNPKSENNSLLGKIHQENDTEKEEPSILFGK